jgi:hypothetical protein
MRQQLYSSVILYSGGSSEHNWVAMREALRLVSNVSEAIACSFCSEDVGDPPEDAGERYRIYFPANSLRKFRR